MKFFAVVAALAGAAAAAMTGTGAVHYTTEVVTAYTTFCPEATKFAYGDKTYTVTEATTITITDCPDHRCTVVKPVYTSTAVSCGESGCGGYSNGTVAHSTGAGFVTSTGSGYTAHPTTSCTGPNCSTVTTSNAGKVAALSGAALAGVLAIAVAL